MVSWAAVAMWVFESRVGSPTCCAWHGFVVWACAVWGVASVPRSLVCPHLRPCGRALSCASWPLSAMDPSEIMVSPGVTGVAGRSIGCGAAVSCICCGACVSGWRLLAVGCALAMM